MLNNGFSGTPNPKPMDHCLGDSWRERTVHLDSIRVYMGVSQHYGYFFGGPHNKDYSILGSVLASPYFGNLGNYRHIWIMEKKMDTTISGLGVWSW